VPPTETERPKKSVAIDSPLWYSKNRRRTGKSTPPQHPCFRGAMMSNANPIRDAQYDWLVHAVKSHNSPECLIWPFNMHATGYGSVLIPSSKVPQGAHRVSFFVMHGHWPTPMARHTCDVRACISPFHVIEGTRQDNSDDKVSRGRQARGSKLPQSKGSPELVRQIRAEYIRGRFGFARLAAKYHLNYKTVYRMVNRETWKHV
jgi:hypothetical protein